MRQAHKISPRITEITVSPTNNFINTTITFTGILLESTVDIAIFVLDRINGNIAAADGMMLVPDDVLGGSYVIPSFWKGDDDLRCKIIGTHDNTLVTITFMSNMSNKIYEIGTPFKFYKHMRKTYSIDYLEVLNIHPYNGDLAGSIVESDKPVAVVYDNPSAIIRPTDANSGHYDKTSTQLLPVNQWGTEYIVPPVYPRAKYLVRVFAYYDGTSITLTSSSSHWSVVINKGEFKEYTLGTEPALVRASNSISVYQYSFSSDYVPGGESSMTLVPSVDSFAKGPYTFATMASYGYFRTFTNYVSIIIDKRLKDQLKYNGTSLQPLATYSVKGLDRYVVVIAQLSSSATVHILSNTAQSATFGLMIYGISHYIQYGFVGGLSFKNTGKQLETTTPNFCLVVLYIPYVYMNA